MGQSLVPTRATRRVSSTSSSSVHFMFTVRVPGRRDCWTGGGGRGEEPCSGCICCSQGKGEGAREGGEQRRGQAMARGGGGSGRALEGKGKLAVYMREYAWKGAWEGMCPGRVVRALIGGGSGIQCAFQ